MGGYGVGEYPTFGAHNPRRHIPSGRTTHGDIHLRGAQPTEKCTFGSTHAPVVEGLQLPTALRTRGPTDSTAQSNEA